VRLTPIVGDEEHLVGISLALSIEQSENQPSTRTSLPFPRSKGSGNITTITSRKNADICELMALISTMAAANCRSSPSSAALLSAEALSEGGTGVDVRVIEEGMPVF